MATYADIKVENEWLDITDGTGISLGVEDLIIQNKGYGYVLISVNSEPPENLDGITIAPLEKIVLSSTIESFYMIAITHSCSVSVESGSSLSTVGSLPTGIPTDLFTSTEEGVRRIGVDSQPTSFEDNKQFRFVDRFVNVSNGDDIVYKVDLGVPVNLLFRELGLRLGGREYFVYPYNSDTEITGSANVTQRSPTPQNNKLKEGLTVHPASNTTFTRYDGVTFTPNDSEAYTDYTMVVADGNNSRATNTYNSDGFMSGTGDSSAFWLYLPHTGATNDNSYGYIKFIWEERDED